MSAGINYIYEILTDICNMIDPKSLLALEWNLECCMRSNCQTICSKLRLARQEASLLLVESFHTLSLCFEMLPGSQNGRPLYGCRLGPHDLSWSRSTT